MSGIGIVDGIAKWLGQSLHGVQVVWGYFLGMLMALLVYVVVARVPARRLLASAHPGMQVARAACLVASLSFLFVSLRYLPLAEATAISFTSPLFTVALAGPFLGERVGWRRWTAVLIGLLGVALIVRPSSALLQWASLLPLIGAFFFATFTVITRYLYADDAVTTLFFTFACGTVLVSAVVPFVWQMPSCSEFGVFIGFGVLGALSHISIVRAMREADASVIAPLNYVRLIWALGLGLLWFEQWPDAMALLGALVIVAAGLYAAVYGASRAA